MKKLLIILLFVAFNTSLFANVTLHVSAKGKVKGEKTFKSITEALDLARKMENTNVNIFIHEGVYYLNKPLAITSEDANATKKLTIEAYQGDNVVISGAELLDLSWKPYKNGIFMAQVPAGLVMDMLVVDGQIRNMARYPNYDKTAEKLNGVAKDAISKQRIAKWKTPEGAYLHAMHKHDWGSLHYRVNGVDDKGELQLEGGWQHRHAGHGFNPDNVMIENVFEELDCPKEWYFNTKTNTLYYYPEKGEDLSKIKVESPQMKNLIVVSGTKSNPVVGLSFKGLKFTQTFRTFIAKEYENLLRSDWRIYRDGAVFVEGSEDLLIEDCDFYNLGGNAIFLSKYNRDAEIKGNHLTDIGASAICFVGDPLCVRSSSFGVDSYGADYSVLYEKMDKIKGAKGEDFPMNCRAEDNLIHDIGIYEKQVAGVQISMSQSITVDHNSIYDVPRAGINIGDGAWGGHVLSHNDVFNTVKETGDHGAFNSWGRDRHWTSDRNYMAVFNAEHPEIVFWDAVKTTKIHNNRFRCDNGWDIDLDDGSSNYHIFNNLCLNGGIKLREGFYRTVENNILVNCTYHPHISFVGNGDIFTRNIVMSHYLPVRVKSWGKLTDYNVFTDSLSYRAALDYDVDQHSIVSAVEFTDPAKGDFSVADDADAVTKGAFRNFAMDFGVRSARLKAKALQPDMPKPVIKQTLRKDEMLDWKGMKFKNLTLGERSATGMYSEKGVYVISVGKTSNALNANDVILAVEGQMTNNIKEFAQELAKWTSQKPITLTVYRNGHEYKLKFR